jgi:phenylalanyl-tRNA synthetase beta chain
MKVPISWLKEYVEFEDSVQGLADKLTFSGVEVEGIETIGGSFPGIVVGEVLSVLPHPNADRLTICRVHTGGDEAVQVVCGAPNVAVGLKVPFAPVGATLPNGMTMKKAKIRQMDSFGMLLAEDELGLSNDHSGLLVLAPHWAPGTPLNDVLGPAETVLDLEITPNRPDCLCLLGIAREVAALYGTELKPPSFQLPETDIPVASLTRIDVDDTVACPRYTARVLQQITIGPSPEWMQKRLTLAGIRPINNVVDITNYVMLETGHPLHAFDHNWLAEGRIVVRRAQAGEKMRTLDDAERALTPEMLVIADGEQAVAVAGIMGGTGSEIRDTTTTVLLESACFDPLRTRATSRNLALSTESSYRFERGVDAATVEWAGRRAAALMVDHAGGRAANGLIDVYPAPVAPRPVSCDWEYIRTVTGLAITNEQITAILASLEMPVVEQDDERFTVQVPTFRGDIERSVDLVEEVARMHGLDRIPTPAPCAEMVPGASDRMVRLSMQLKHHLIGLGLREIMNYSLTSPALLDLFDADDRNRRIVLPHPISVDQSVLRPSLLPQMVETIGRNHARQIPETLFFEAGRTFARQNGTIVEQDRIAVGLMGPVGRGTCDKRKPVQPGEMYAWMKGLIEGLFRAQHLDTPVVQPVDVPGFEPGTAVEVRDGDEVVGVMGLLRSDLRREWRLSGPVALAELSQAALLRRAGTIPRARAVPVYPAISRDMALMVDARITHADILRVVHAHAEKELEKVELFDIFEGDAIGVGRKSMAFNVVYRSESRTLTDEEANGYHERVKDALRRELDVSIREG